MDKKVSEIIQKSLSGTKPTVEEIAYLFKFDTNSQEVYNIRWAANKLARELSNNTAEVHAQIGIDASACYKNCEFCSFAAVNKLRSEKLEMPLEEILQYAKGYEKAGANLICLMITASYDFDKFIEVGREVRKVISSEMPLMANLDDFSYEQALKLKEVGFDGVYHVVHMGEGEITEIDPKTRIQTMENALKAGLKLSSCVEPIGYEHADEYIAECMDKLLERDLKSTGCGWRIPVPNSKFSKERFRTIGEWQKLTAIDRVAASDSITLLGNMGYTCDSGANYAWAEVGTNPRDVAVKTEKSSAKVSYGVKELQKTFMSFGWNILKGPSKGWRD
ncbi:radical SAM protein [Lagierella sp.]|uniref:radical SAM protein n=1 Tax=Lagierella sp. TaxID=2849657 RepID=UPI0026027A9A|nr:radical SAM protein [Lagierella sp.]